MHAAVGHAVCTHLEHLRCCESRIELVFAIVNFRPWPSEEVVVPQSQRQRQAIAELVVILRIEREVKLPKPPSPLLILVCARCGSSKKQVGNAKASEIPGEGHGAVLSERLIHVVL